MSSEDAGYAPIESYALIGDCETAALVGLDGSIDWLCWPDFSSGACLARLLGNEDNGMWRIAPSGAVAKRSRRYRPHTLILETTFETAEGVVTLIDFMPIRGTNSDIVRVVKGVRGSVAMRMDFVLRFDYGRSVPWVTRMEGGLKAIAGPDLALLRTDAPLRGEDMRTVSDFTVHQGESVSFALTYGRSHEQLPRPIHVDKALEQTQQFWEEWAARCTYEGPYREQVERSMITLKALIYRPTGGIVAAVTTSLPEQIGGPRNWDYRYCWLRDATLTLLALMNGGYYHEAKQWHEWLLRAVAGSPDQVQIMYGIAGERRLPEWEIDWLSGYEHSAPVRVGNAASNQLQLDIYGELMDAFYHAQRQIGRDNLELEFRLQTNLVEHLETIWREPDEGIWETRGGKQNFTYSKAMAWVAFDRAVKIAERIGAKAPVDRWRKVRDEIHEDVCTRGFNQKLGSFVQSYGSEELDASLLMLPLAGFLPHDDPRVVGTTRAIQDRLMSDGLVMRYNTQTVHDGLPPGEGVFLACSFWMTSNLFLQGREQDAIQMFEKLLSLTNDVGLLSEEYDTRRKRLVGNFPQAFSHVSLVNAAFDLASGRGAVARRSAHSENHDVYPDARHSGLGSHR